MRNGTMVARSLHGSPAAIENAIASETVYDRLAALKPTLPLYALLKRELARYRAIEKEGGLVPASDGICAQARRER